MHHRQHNCMLSRYQKTQFWDKNVPLEKKWIRAWVSNCTRISYPSATHEKQQDFEHVSNGMPLQCSFSVQERGFPNSNRADIDRSLKYCSLRGNRSTGCDITDIPAQRWAREKVKLNTPTVLSPSSKIPFAFIQIVCGWAPLGAVSWQTCGYPGRWNCHLRQLHNLLLWWKRWSMYYTECAFFI